MATLNELRRIVQDGEAAWSRMVERGDGIGGSSDEDSDAIEAYEDTFGLAGEGPANILALIGGAPSLSAWHGGKPDERR